jgi:NADH:ubiquinone oxidoreductase subunit 5 (subunit L)/multisubunit Na+/H+ antiporter MnhA subunit
MNLLGFFILLAGVGFIVWLGASVSPLDKDDLKALLPFCCLAFVGYVMMTKHAEG